MKNLYCAYYTNSDFITTYMTDMLQLSENDRILEPSAGEGVFVEAILRRNPSVQIDALDLNPETISVLHHKFDDLKGFVTIRETDTLFDAQLDLYNAMGGYYDKIIANPPYGAWQDYERRAILKKKYPGYYVKETYALFLLRCLSVLKSNGRLCFIIPDTFMYLNMHESIRRTLLLNSKIRQVVIFPSKFFPGISFGYSDLCIITLEKTEQEQDALDNFVEIVKGLQSAEELPAVASGKIPSHLSRVQLKQGDIIHNKNARFLIDLSNAAIDMNRIPTVLGEVAHIVTGFYSGDNSRFIRVRDKSVKGAKNYEVIDMEQVSDRAAVEGIMDGSKKYIPYVKSAPKNRYLQGKDEWYVRWDQETVSFYKSDKKARFQNSQFYFRKGISIPMVKSSTLRASLMENRVFDQAIVGIFPEQEKMLYYLLAFLNSDIACRMIRIINPTANNSSNYVKQLPFIVPEENELSKITNAVRELLQLLKDEEKVKSAELIKYLNHHFETMYLKELSAN